VSGRSSGQPVLTLRFALHRPQDQPANHPDTGSDDSRGTIVTLRSAWKQRGQSPGRAHDVICLKNRHGRSDCPERFRARRGNVRAAYRRTTRASAAPETTGCRCSLRGMQAAWPEPRLFQVLPHQPGHLEHVH
jgi:hypothetical protein